MHKIHTRKPQKCLVIHSNVPMSPFTLKNNYVYNRVKKYTYKSENTLITPFILKNNHVKKHTHKYKKNSFSQ